MVGVYGLSLISVSISGLLLLALNLKQNLVLRSLLVIIPIAIFYCGHYLQQQSWTQKIGEPIRVSMVQANISQHSRWDNNFLHNIKKQYYDLSKNLWSKTDIIVWPENAIPIFYQYEKTKFFKKIKTQVDKNSVTFITGVPYLNTEQGEYYNSLLRMESNSTAFYFKQQLVPFGEYLPFEKWLRGLIRFFNIPMSGFSLPPQQQKIMTVKGIPVAITLCYEDVYPSLLSKQLPNAQFLINLSNNGWYGDSLAPHQHLQIAQMRALETGRNLIRSTTSGISAFVNYKGKIIKQSKQFEVAILSSTIQPRTGLTPYVQYKNKLTIIYALFLICVMFIYIQRKGLIKLLH